MSDSTKCWSLVKSSGVCPTARSGHSAVVAKESLYIFGGCGHPAVRLAGRSPAQTSTVSGAEFDREAMPVCLRDLHVYDLARQRWSEVIPKDLSVTPVERTCAAMCASEEEDRLFLSGGAGDDPNDLRADLLEFHVRRRTWRLLFDGNESSPHSACRRIGHAMVHDSARNRLVMFGGSTGFEYFDDTQAFDLATRRWSVLDTKGERPTPRYKHQAFMDSDSMYIVGGGSFEPEGPDLDVFRLHLGGPKALVWERVRPTGKPPCCRAAHGLAWDKVGRTAYIWGGFTTRMELDNTFCALRLPPVLSSRHATPTKDHRKPRASPLREARSGRAAFPAPDPRTCQPPASDGATPPNARGVTTRSPPLTTVAANTVHGTARQAATSGVAGQRAKPRRVVPAALRVESGHPNPPRRAAVLHLHQQHQHPHRRSSGMRAAPDAAAAGGGGNGSRNRGPERWGRRGQRLWRHSGEGADGGRRRRSCGGGRRRPWGQGWASGRLQGLWGGGNLQSVRSSHSPPPPPATQLPLADHGGGTLSPVVRGGTRVTTMGHPPETRIRTPAAESSATPSPRDGKLAWISLPVTSEPGDADVTSSPAGRSFHCVFFHSGACYVTGGSDGDRKFDDMWRFAARETPPPLTTLAARAVVAAAEAGEGVAAVSDPGGYEGGVDFLPLGLPEEIHFALANLNIQAEVVI